MFIIKNAVKLALFDTLDYALVIAGSTASGFASRYLYDLYLNFLKNENV